MQFKSFFEASFLGFVYAPVMCIRSAHCVHAFECKNLCCTGKHATLSFSCENGKTSVNLKMDIDEMKPVMEYHPPVTPINKC